MKGFLRAVKYTIALILLVLIGVGVYYWMNIDNVNVVVPGKVYRSAQLTGPELEALVKQYNIKSVINLRGAAKGEAWYDQEMKATQDLGVKHYDLRLQAHTKPSPELLRALVLTLQAAPRPVLIHCKGGADRTGMASAFILLLDEQSFQQADQQISWRYFAISRDSVGRLVMPYYLCFLDRNNLVSSKQTFLQWVAEPNPYVKCP